MNSKETRSTASAAGPASPDRRTFIEGTAAALAAGALGLSPLGVGEVQAQELEPQGFIGPVNASKRQKQAYSLRVNVARRQRERPVADHPTNGDEERYPNKIASYTKGLPHNPLGEVDLSAYDALIRALSTGRPADFEAIPLGGPRKLNNPQAALAFELEGPDSHSLTMPAPPAFASAETAGEMVELYWQALLRDVRFSDFESNPLASQAASDLTRLSDFRGLKDRDRVTAATLFRADIPGVLGGPYLSQFLLFEVPFGPQTINQQIRPPVTDTDYLTSYPSWLANQNSAPPGQQQLDSTRRYVINGRDLARWVQVDVLFQAYFNAVLLLLGSRAPFDGGNPYNTSANQMGVGVLGFLQAQSLPATISTRAFKAIWFQKWSVHRRLRPEMFGGRIHNHLTGAASYPIHSDVLNSPALSEVFRKNNTYLLPQAFVEGSPTHPSYAAGHAGIAGACVTVLKAFFDESAAIPNPVVPSADGLSLLPYEGSPLTVGGELNKLCWNIAMGRDFGGIHYRSDQLESMKLGEEVAIRFLREEKECFNEAFRGFSLTKFDGTTITV